jgi:hypothetical protein
MGGAYISPRSHSKIPSPELGSEIPPPAEGFFFFFESIREYSDSKLPGAELMIGKGNFVIPCTFSHRRLTVQVHHSLIPCSEGFTGKIREWQLYSTGGQSKIISLLEDQWILFMLRAVRCAHLFFRFLDTQNRALHTHSLPLAISVYCSVVASWPDK